MFTLHINVTCKFYCITLREYGFVCRQKLLLDFVAIKDQEVQYSANA